MDLFWITTMQKNKTIMKHQGKLKLYAVASLLVVFGCTNETIKDSEGDNAETAEVSFILQIPADQTKAVGDPLDDHPWVSEAYTSCAYGFDEYGVPVPTDIKTLRAHVKLEKTLDKTPEHPGEKKVEFTINLLSREDGTLVTEPITIDANTEYSITDFIVHGTEPFNPTIYFSDVDENAPFAAYVEKTTPHKFTIPPFTKINMDFSVLCARGREPLAFGKPKFTLEREEAFCIPVFVDVCDKSGEDFVADGLVSVKKLMKAGKPVVADFASLAAVKDILNSGIISYLCFSDNIDRADAEEWFLIEISYKDPDDASQTIIKNEISSLDKIKQYATSKNWDKTYDFLDILICDNRFCIFNCDEQ